MTRLEHGHGRPHAYVVAGEMSPYTALTTLDHGHGAPHAYITASRRTAAIEEVCSRCRGTKEHPAADILDVFKGKPCPGCKGTGKEAKAEWEPTQLPAHQQNAREEPDWQQSKRQLLDIAKNRVPGTKVWRGEIRHKDALAKPPSVGLHWSVDSDQIVTPAEDPPPNHHRVIWEGEIDHPDQAFSRSHPVWSGIHRSMDSESEVRFKPGGQVRLTRRYVHDNSTGNTTFVPHKHGVSDVGWRAHDMDHSVEVAHRPTSDTIDYSDVGIHKGAVTGRPLYHGTTVEHLTHVLPASQHGGRALYDETDHSYTYATHDLAGAWDYAADAHAAAREKGQAAGRVPRVYEVRPLHGDHSHVEDDPNYEGGVYRGTHPGDRRSRVGFETVRELPMPQHVHDYLDEWHAENAPRGAVGQRTAAARNQPVCPTCREWVSYAVPNGWEHVGGTPMCPISRTAAQESMSIRMVPPEEYRKFEFPDYPHAKTPAALARHFKKTSPEYYGKIKNDVQQNGIKTPMLVKWTDQRGKPLKKPQAMSGHHRAAVAHELGLHMPVGDYDNPADHDLARQTEQKWFQENERPIHDRPGYTAAAHAPLYHGTSKPDLTHILPSTQHGTEVFSGLSSPDHAYATSDLAEARKYADLSALVHGGEPHVYHVRHLGPPSGLEPDSGYDPDVRSRHGFGVVRELAPHELPKSRFAGKISAAGVDDRAAEVGPGHEWRQGLPPEHEEVVRHWEKHSPSMTSAERATFRKVIKSAPTMEGPVYRGAMVKGAFYQSQIENSHKPGQPVKFSRNVSVTRRPEIAAGYGHVVYEIHSGQSRALGNRLHEGIHPPAEFVVHSTEWRDQTPARASIDERTMYASPRLHVVLHPAGAEKTAASSINVPPDYHREHPETWGSDYHRYAAESPHAAAIGQAQEHLRMHVPAYETSLPDSETEAGESLQHMLRRGGHPRADEAFVTRHRDPRRGSSNVVYDPDDQEVPGVALHPSRWDYGTLAHEAAHILHHREIGRQRHSATPDGVMHGHDFARHFQFTLGMVHRRAPEEFEKARTQALARIQDATGVGSQGARATKKAGLSTSPLAPPTLSRLALMPVKRLFGPTYGLDHRLFDGEHLKSDVRRYIFETLADFWKGPYGCDWDEWAQVYLAGSEASEWTSAELEGNGDFDVLIGVDYEKFRGHMSRTDPWQTMTDEEITARFNEQFKRLNAQTANAMIMVDGKLTGPWENTWYVNKNSYDIRRIKPYAAYNVSTDEWAVKPPHLPAWDISQFPEGPALVAECQAVSAYAQAILNMPEPYRTQQGYALWHHLHSDRARAFSDLGEGWYDPGNVIEKFLDQQGLWEKLVKIMVRVRNDPSAMNAPADWSNMPPGASNR